MVCIVDNIDALGRNMKHMGVLSADVDPVVPGGVPEESLAPLLDKGWIRGTTKYDVTNAGVAFSDPELPGGVVLRLVDIPAGTDYIANPSEGTAIILGCGNATCWRYLL